MTPKRTARQEIEQLEYIGDMIRQLSRMAAEDDHRLLCYILNTASFEIEDLKRVRREAGVSNDRGHNTAGAALNTARQFKL